MIAFEIYINGKKRCTAGAASEFGMLTALLTWAKRDTRRLPAAVRSEVAEEDLKIIVSGQRTRSDNDLENLQWKSCALEPGDEIRIKIVETERVDDPERVRKVHPEFFEKQRSDDTLH